MSSLTKHTAFVLVNYFNDDEVILFAESYLFKDDTSNLQVYIVNNGSKKPGYLDSKINFNSKIILIQASNNSGYFGAFNLALDYHKSHFDFIPDIFVLCNTDLKIESSDWIQQLLIAADNPQTGLIGPSLISSLTGKQQNPFLMERMNSKKIDRLLFFFSSYVGYLIYQSLYYFKAKLTSASIKISNSPTPCYAIHGAFIAMTSKFIHAASPDFKSAPFLYAEELFLAEIAEKHSFKSIYLPSIKIIHDEHSTTGIFKSKKGVELMHASLLKIKSLFYL
jgi:GT2 family glycosyltransferase